MEDGAVVVGHSVGRTILVNYLAEGSSERTLSAIVLIAVPFVGAGGWPGDELELRRDLGARLPHGTAVHLFQGLSDPVVPPEHVDLYARARSQAQLNLLPGRDHQLNDDLSEVARAIAPVRSRAS